MRFILAAVALAAMPAAAATLATDALLCESVADLEFVTQTSHLNGKGGAEVIKQAGLSVKFHELRAQSANYVHDRNRSPGEEAANAKAESLPYQRITNACAASGPATQVVILERRAISGMVKVKTTYQGRPTELWTFAAAVTD